MPYDIRRFLESSGIDFLPELTLSELSSIGMGNAKALVALPRCEDELIRLLRFLTAENKQYRIVGGMTNLLPPDNNYDGALVCTRKMRDLSFTGDRMTAAAGVRMSGAIISAADLSLGGLEALSGIPGTLGGMVYSNAGAYGSEISDFIISARVYSKKDDAVITLDNRSLGFSYRDSILRTGEHVLLSAVLRFLPVDKAEVLDRLRTFGQKRRQAQPTGKPSLGSVFKRVDGVSAAYYIDKAGLKGCSLGCAEVSLKHAGFIVNRGGTLSADFKALVSYITETVYDKFGVRLVPEVEYL